MSRQAKSFHSIDMPFALCKDWEVSLLEADLTLSPLKAWTLPARKRSGSWRGAVKPWERPRCGHCLTTQLETGAEDSTFN